MSTHENQTSLQSIQDSVGISQERTWRPVRNLLPWSSLAPRVEQLRNVQKTTPAKGNPKPAAGQPQQLISISAGQTITRTQNKVMALVAITFTRQFDKNFAGVHVWFTGFKGSPTPVEVFDGAVSPVIFLEENTGETVTVTVQPFGPTGVSIPLAQCLTTQLTLGGPGVPPAPTMAQTTTTVTSGGITLGQQLAFNFLPNQFVDVVDGYWIYRVPSHLSPVAPAGRFKFVRHSPSDGSVYTFQDMSGVSTNFYYISSVSTVSGLESSLTDAIGSITTVFRPTTNTAIQNGGYTNPTKTYDGNSQSYAQGIRYGNATQASSWQGFSATGGGATTIKLKINSATNCSGGGSALLKYSLDGSTFTTVYTKFSSTGLIQTSINLSAAQDLTLVSVFGSCTANSAGQYASQLVYEIWIEVT